MVSFMNRQADLICIQWTPPDEYSNHPLFLLHTVLLVWHRVVNSTKAHDFRTVCYKSSFNSGVTDMTHASISSKELLCDARMLELKGHDPITDYVYVRIYSLVEWPLVWRFVRLELV